VIPGNTYLREGFDTVDLLIKVGCFCKKIIFEISQAADLSRLVQGGELY
jgi:hypothetical protein